MTALNVVFFREFSLVSVGRLCRYPSGRDSVFVLAISEALQAWTVSMGNSSLATENQLKVSGAVWRGAGPGWWGPPYPQKGGSIWVALSRGVRRVWVPCRKMQR